MSKRRKNEIPRSQVPSLAGAARRARTADSAARKAASGKPLLNTVTSDSFQNFMAKFGVGTDNLTSAGTYGFNPISRQRIILEWAHRGNWLSGCAVDIIADDMTRAGVDIVGGMQPDDIERINTAATTLKIWNSINQTIKWARLYGGCIGVLLIDGQDVSTPLRVESVARGQFKGILPLDRWMVEPDLTRRVRTIGPDLGLPEWYKVIASAPAFVGERIHYTRVLRMTGIELPYWQSMMENMWGVSVLERLWDRQLAFDSSTTGIAQLIYKCYLRTLKVDGLRDLVSTGTDEQMAGLARYVDMTRRFQSVEGFTLIDGADEFGEHTGASVSVAGVGEAMDQIGQQISGALEMPLTRLFGQAPAGMNATGESDMRNYYDGINHRQKSNLLVPVTTVYRCIALSEGIQVDDSFGIEFRSLWQLTDVEKSDIAQKTSEAVGGAYDRGIISPKTALQELRQSSKTTGVFTNITDEDIDAAEDEPVPPAGAEGTGEEDVTGLESAARGGAAADGGTRRIAVRDSVQRVAALAWNHGLQTVVETPEGTIRRGAGWQVVMPADYGYIRATRGADAEQVDCFIGPSPESPNVFVINQKNPDTGAFDEHKVMLGYFSEEGAVRDYYAAHTNSGEAQKRIIGVVPMQMSELKNWLQAGDLTAPVERRCM